MQLIHSFNKKVNKLIDHLFTNRILFILMLTFFYWIKCLYSYKYLFWFSNQNILQKFNMYINPIPVMLILLGLTLLIKSGKLFYIVSILISLINTAFLYANIIYYRGFLNFLSTTTIVTGKSNLTGGLTDSIFSLILNTDIWFFLDLIIIIIMISIKYFKLNVVRPKFKISFLIILLGLCTFSLNILVTKVDNPNIVAETATQNKQNDFVRYLGFDNNIIFDAYQFYNSTKNRNNASKKDLKPIIKFNKDNYATPNPKYYGSARGKNVIFIHLESFQQFLIDLKVNGKPVTPFLNELYHSNSTYSFDNFYNQVGQGRTADAENMIENSTYGLPKGSLFPEYGGINTFQSMPEILRDNGGYTSAVFHGNDGNFYNRNTTYKNLGYNYFFDSNSYNMDINNLNGMGLKDKLLFKQSEKYINHLQQPFYAKFITITNHVPYVLNENDISKMKFKTSNTHNPSVDNYLITAHYLDQSIKEFYDYLHKSGLDKNSMIVIYGDHYGIYQQDELALSSLIKADPDNFNESYHTELQKVPFMINIPGATSGYIDHTYGGEIDIRPTILDLLGIKNSQYIQFGSDLLSNNHSQLVALRNRDWVTPKYTYTNGHLYYNSNHKLVKMTPKLALMINNNQQEVNKRLTLSDDLNNNNLLRFYNPSDFTKVNPNKFNYLNQYQQEKSIEKRLNDKSTALK